LVVYTTKDDDFMAKTKSDPLEVVMALARKDAQFFHDLVFAPKKALSRLTSIDRGTKSRMAKVKAGSVLSAIPGLRASCGNDETCSGATCNNTCAESCGGQTCGGGSCDRTCENSCDDTIDPPERRRGGSSLVSARWDRVGPRVRGGRKRPIRRR
jgi:hypothetical protein